MQITGQAILAVIVFAAVAGFFFALGDFLFKRWFVQKP